MRESTVTSRFVEELELFRNRRKLTCSALASLCGIPESTLGNWLNGVHRPSLSRVETILERLGLDRVRVFGTSGRPSRGPSRNELGLLDSRADSYDRLLASGRGASAVAVLRSAALDLYQLYHFHGFPVRLEADATAANERLVLTFPFHATLPGGGHRIYVYGECGPRVLLRRSSPANEEDVISGVLGKSVARAIWVYLGDQMDRATAGAERHAKECNMFFDAARRPVTLGK